MTRKPNPDNQFGKVISAKCFQCCCGDGDAVRECASGDCVLWKYRPMDLPAAVIEPEPVKPVEKAPVKRQNTLLGDIDLGPLPKPKSKEKSTKKIPGKSKAPRGRSKKA